jgi:hypothetical protein
MQTEGTAEAELNRLAEERAAQSNLPFLTAYSEVLMSSPNLYERYLKEREHAARYASLKKSTAINGGNRSSRKEEE